MKKEEARVCYVYCEDDCIYGPYTEAIARETALALAQENGYEYFILRVTGSATPGRAVYNSRE